MTSVSHISYYLLLQIFANEHEKIYLAHTTYVQKTNTSHVCHHRTK